LFINRKGKTMDHEDVLTLLKVVALAKDYPNLRALHDLAMGLLSDKAVEAQKELDKRAKAKAEAEAKAKAEADKKAAEEKKAADAKKAADDKAAAQIAARPVETAHTTTPTHPVPQQ
jgi:predicted Holliday junction resolvase-like endonuclease